MRISSAVYVSLTATLALILDRFTKYAITAILSEGQSIKILPNIFHLTLVLNKGAAFGLFREGRISFITLSLSVISFIIYYIWRNKFRGAYIIFALGLILGGAIGNLIDRIRFGYVIDFLDLRIWPVFNVADSAISIGAAMLVWSIFLKHN